MAAPRGSGGNAEAPGWGNPGTRHESPQPTLCIAGQKSSSSLSLSTWPAACSRAVSMALGAHMMFMKL